MDRTTAINFLVNNPAKFGHMIGFKDLNDMHNTWIHDMICKREDHTLQASRGTYKTTCVSISLSVTMVLLPYLRSLFMRKTDSDVKEVIMQVKKILQDEHTRYLSRCIWGCDLFLTTDNATELSTNLVSDIKGTAQLVGLGVGSSLTGKHYDRIYTDDIVNVKDRVSKAERDRTKLIYQELINIKNRGGRIYNTGTPWHKEDCFTLMPDIERWDCYQTGMFSPEQIEELKNQMSPSLFAANYELRHIADEDEIFSDPVIGASFEKIRDGFGHVDAAYEGEDYTAFTLAKLDGSTLYLYGRMWRKNVADVYGEIFDLYTKSMCGKLYMETNADKGFAARDLKKLGVRTATYAESMNKYIKIVTYLKGVWKNVVFVDGTDDEYIEQIVDYTEDAEHDDAPDSAACVARLIYKKLRRNEDDNSQRHDVTRDTYGVLQVGY